MIKCLLLEPDLEKQVILKEKQEEETFKDEMQRQGRTEKRVPRHGPTNAEQAVALTETELEKLVAILNPIAIKRHLAKRESEKDPIKEEVD